MAKLYPPYIEGKIPSQCSETIESQQVPVLRIPFELNRAIGENDINNVSVKAQIKTVSSDTILGTWGGTWSRLNNKYITEIPMCNRNDSGSLEVYPLTVGTYYKVQLAFVTSSGTEGYYSTVGVFKYIGVCPQVSISGLNAVDLNLLTGPVIGEYSASQDPLEKPYTYKFNLYDDSGLVETSDVQFFYGQSNANYTIKTNMEKRKYYYLQFKVTTVNDLVISSPLYTIYMNTVELKFTLPIDFFANIDRELGCIRLYMQGLEDEPIIGLKGTFKISRSSSLNDFASWEPIEILKINTQYNNTTRPVFELYQDFTVEQGVRYKYAIEQFDPDNSLITSKKITSDQMGILVDFDDIFLYDGERQLKIKYNPKVSSFKITTLESKKDTIGGAYPFFFRNGRVAYKDFPIGGLISYWMDDAGTFISGISGKKRIHALRTQTQSVSSEKEENNFPFLTNLTSENIAAEREFREEVLDWLNNGQPKLFRSPTEGNYIIRLFQISLTPDEKLGRMLYSFSAQSVEIDEYNHDNLVKYGFAGNEKLILDNMQMHTKHLKQGDKITPTTGIQYAKFINTPDGAVFKLSYQNGDSKIIRISRVGTYEVPIDETNLPISIEILSVPNNKICTLEYGHQKPVVTGIYDAEEKQITNYEVQEVCDQYFSDEIISFEDYDLINIFLLRFQQKDIEIIYHKDGNYYEDRTCKIRKNLFLKTVLYQCNDKYYIYTGTQLEPIEDIGDYDNLYNYKIINSGQTNIYRVGKAGITYSSFDFDMDGIFNFCDSIELGKGVYADIYYQKTQLTYKEV